MKVIRTIDNLLEKMSSSLLVVVVLTMLFLSVLVIVLRWFNITFLWYDPFVRHLVFISAFLGGIVATGRGNHIGIDILNKYLESKNNHVLRSKINFVVGIVGAASLLWLAHACYKFTLVEMEFGKVAFWGIHSGFLVAIVPIGFCLISLRFFLRAIIGLKEVV